MGHPIFLYRRLADGGLEARIFDSDALPPDAEGWSDSPSGADEAASQEQARAADQPTEAPPRKRAKASTTRKRER
ncbi:MAG: hypothetical protein ACOY3L_03630 [Pseudomonadota bacterium]